MLKFIIVHATSLILNASGPGTAIATVSLCRRRSGLPELPQERLWLAPAGEVASRGESQLAPSVAPTPGSNANSIATCGSFDEDGRPPIRDAYAAGKKQSRSIRSTLAPSSRYASSSS